MARRSHPVIGFLSDFGFDGAAGTCRGVMLGICPDAQIVDISHAVAKTSIADGAFILASALPYLPVGVHVAVVDPGVGTERRAIAIRAERGDVLVGPDNGLLIDAAGALGGVAEARELTNRNLWLVPDPSDTFHGRDVFAPVAARLAAGTAAFKQVGPTVDPSGLVRLPALRTEVGEGRIATAVAYVDSFGNLRLAAEAEALDRAVPLAETGTRLRARVGDVEAFDVVLAPSFGHVEPGAALLYRDSSGHLALGANGRSLADRIGGVARGASVVLERPEAALGGTR